MTIILRSFCLVLLGFCLGGQSLRAQPGAGTYRGEVGVAGALRSDLPFWLHANRDAVFDAHSAGGYTRLAAVRRFPVGRRITVTAGADLLARVASRSTFHLSEAYVETRVGLLRAYVGRRHEVTGTTSGPLSMGSLGTSRNATPVPKVVLTTTGYTDVPFTRGYIEVKGSWAHGWLGERRYVDSPFLHQKTAYVRLGGDLPVRGHVGLVHNALWGGTSPEHGPLPASFADYARTVVALNGSEDAPPDEQVYIQGDHVGIYDVGLEVELGNVAVQAYRQFIYEDRDNIKFKSPQDGLLGLSVAWDSGFVHRVTYEHLYTKWQNGPLGPAASPGQRGGYGGRDDYYNHGIYRSGWTYDGRTLGTPLLTPVSDTKDGRRGIMNNRVVGHHVGVAGDLGTGARYRFLATYTRNYGTYHNPFEARRDQWSFLLETRVSLPDAYGLGLVVGLAADRGALYRDSIGLHVGLVRRGTW